VDGVVPPPPVPRRSRDDARPGTPGRTLAAAGTVLAAAAALALTHALLVRTAAGQRWDASVLLGRGDRDPLIALARERYDDLWMLVAVLLALALAALLAARATLAAAVACGVAVSGAVATTQVLKALLDRPRLMVGTDLPGFPSGHTTAVTALALTVVLLAPPRWRVAAALAATLASGLAGVAVLGAGWHRASDAIGAHLVCLAWAAAAVTALSATRRLRPVTRGGVPAAAWAGRAALAVLIPVAVALLAARWVDRSPGVVPDGVADDLRRQALAVGASALAVCTATAALVRGADAGRRNAWPGRRRAV
jgi:hypothetical protein